MDLSVEGIKANDVRRGENVLKMTRRRCVESRMEGTLWWRAGIHGKDLTLAQILNHQRFGPLVSLAREQIMMYLNEDFYISLD